jgi:ABC-type transporter Mla MlaB component
MNFGRPRGQYRWMAASGSHTVAFAVRGPIARSDLQGLCDRVCAVLSQNRADVAYCDVAGLEPDAVTVEALARLQLGARRVGCQVRLQHASEDLLQLVAFMGLRNVLPE